MCEGDRESDGLPDEDFDTGALIQYRGGMHGVGIVLEATDVAQAFDGRNAFV
jgi:hypothetical protein